MLAVRRGLLVERSQAAILPYLSRRVGLKGIEVLLGRLVRWENVRARDRSHLCGRLAGRGLVVRKRCWA